MKILITGGTGYIGVPLTQHLIGQGHTVYAVGIEDYDIRNALSCECMIDDTRPDLVIHLAAIANITECERDPDTALSTNIVGTKYLLEAMVARNVANIILASSAAVYGDVYYTPITEGHPVSSRNMYGRTKIEAEALIQKYYAEGWLNSAAIMRIFNPVGSVIPRDKGSLFSNILRTIESKQDVLDIYGLGTYRDYLDMRDLMNLFSLLEVFLRIGEPKMVTLNACSQAFYSPLDIVDYFKLRGYAVPTMQRGSRPDDIAQSCGSFQAAKNLLSWEPREGMFETVDNVIEENL